MLGRLRTAISGLLDIFQNVSGPFFKNSKQVFQDILEIFKKCKEMEKITKSSFFKEEEISDLMSEIKEELRKENTTKLAKHVATLYKYRNSPHYNEMTDKVEKGKRKSDSRLSISEESSETKAVNRLSDSESDSKGSNETATWDSALTSKDTPSGNKSGKEKTEPGKDQNFENNNETTQNTASNLEDTVHKSDGNVNHVDVDSETLAGAVGRAGDTGSQEDTTEQKLKQAVIDYGTHIEDPILQIIFDTALHLAVAKSAKKQIEATSAAGDSGNKSKPQENGANGTGTIQGHEIVNSITIAQDVKPVKSASDESVTDVIDSAIMSVCSGDCDSAEVAALKNSARRKVEEMCFQDLGESVETQTPGDASAQTAISYDANGEPILECSSLNKEADIPLSGSRFKSQDSAEGDTNKKSDSSAEKSGFPTNHRTLCIRICKALNTQLTCMQQELNRKWLAYKFGCDENATDTEIFEAIQGKMIESHEKNGRPLSLSDLPGGKNETDSDAKAKSDDLKTSKKDGENAQVSEGLEQSDKAEVDSEDTEGASADVVNGNKEKERSSG